MATGRKTVAAQQPVTPTWGNQVWDQSVQTFMSDADRTAQFPSPLPGAVTWLDDMKRLELWDGAQWAPQSATRAGERTAVTSAGGDLVVTFAYPFAVVCTMCAPVDRHVAAGFGAIIWKVVALSKATATLRAFGGTGTTPIASVSLTVGYLAVGI